jgi:hypothetical protein
MKTNLNSRKSKILFLFAFLLFLANSESVDAGAEPNSHLLESKIDPKVRGQVIDENEKGMPGIIVLVKGSTTGTATDINGFFELNLSKFSEEKLTLVMSFPDYPSKEIEVNMKKLPQDMGQIKMRKGAE